MSIKCIIMCQDIALLPGCGGCQTRCGPPAPGTPSPPPSGRTAAVTRGCNVWQFWHWCNYVALLHKAPTNVFTQILVKILLIINFADKCSVKAVVSWVVGAFNLPSHLISNNVPHQNCQTLVMIISSPLKLLTNLLMLTCCCVAVRVCSEVTSLSSSLQPIRG